MQGAKTFFLLLGLGVVSALAQAPPAPPSGPAPGNAGPLAPVTPPPPPTLTTDLEEFNRLLPFRQLNKLVLRYLLNDAEFQAFVRIMNSNDAFMLRMRLRTQPEWIQFQTWFNTQLRLSGGGSFEFEESEELLQLFNPTPYWTTYGWQGFFNEFMAYFPQAMIRAHIDAKVMMGGSFAQFWARVRGLRPLYERMLTFPEAQRLITQLQANRIDTQQIDQFLRSLFDWVDLPPVAGAAPAGPAAGQVSAPVAVPVRA